MEIPEGVRAFNQLLVRPKNHGVLTACSIRRLVDTDESMTQLEHVVSVLALAAVRCSGRRIIPQRNDDKLRVLRAVFDVVRDNRYVAEVKCRINLVHEVERSRLERM